MEQVPSQDSDVRSAWTLSPKYSNTAKSRRGGHWCPFCVSGRNENEHTERVCLWTETRYTIGLVVPSWKTSPIQLMFECFLYNKFSAFYIISYWSHSSSTVVVWIGGWHDLNKERWNEVCGPFRAVNLWFWCCNILHLASSGNFWRGWYSKSMSQSVAISDIVKSSPSFPTSVSLENLPLVDIASGIILSK